MTLRSRLAVPLLLLSTLLAPAPDAHAARHTNGNYIVTLNGQDNPTIVARFHGVARRRTWTSALRGFSATLTAAQADRLEQDTRVQALEPDATVYALAQTIPTGVRRIGTLSNSVAAINGIDTRVNADVAIIDTGIDLTHPDLNVYQHVSFSPSNTTGNDPTHGHGTHVAGTVAALDNLIGVVGVAPGARLWAVKVLDDSGSGALSQVISGVDYVTQHASEIEVANMSLGGQGDSPALRAAIDACVAAGVVVVVAAGNNGFEVYGGDRVLGTADDFYPASFSSALTVSALVDTDGLLGGFGATSVYGRDDTTASFSNWSGLVDASNPAFSPGGKIDVAAPGVNIYSTIPGGGYGYKSGTSMACPHVAGAAALYCASVGRATSAVSVAAIRQAIIDRAEPQSMWGVNPTNPRPSNDLLPEGLLSVLRIGQTYSQTGSLPVVTITAPTNQLVTTSAVSIPFTGTATDADDGTISANLVWTSSALGQIGTGASFSRPLPSGNHLISARVTDSHGNMAGKALNVTVQAAGNNPPTLVITAPTNNAVFATGTTVTFSGVAQDVEDGTISSSIKWFINGTQLATGASTTCAFGNGFFTVVATVTDSATITTTNQVSIQVSATAPTPPPATNYPPAISILQPASGLSFPQGTSITFVGSATDREDGTISANIVWTDSVAGALGTGASVAATPAVGAHTVTATVKDSLLATNRASITLTVTSNVSPPSPLAVSVSASPSSVVHKQKTLLTATVTSGGSPVANATCQFSVRGASGVVQNQTLYTGSTGVASYYYQVNRSRLGAGTATVTVNAAKTGYTSAAGSTTFTVLP